MKHSWLMGGLAAFALSTAMAEAPAEYQAFVQQGYAGQKPLLRIAIVPFACPAKLECAEFEEEIFGQLTKRTGSEIVASNEVSDLMERANFRDLGEREARLIIAEGLSVDAFAFISIPKAEVVAAAPSQNDKWANFKREVSVKRAVVDLRVIDRDGRLLLQVNGKAELHDSVRGLPSIAANLFEEMLERAWP